MRYITLLFVLLFVSGANAADCGVRKICKEWKDTISHKFVKDCLYIDGHADLEPDDTINPGIVEIENVVGRINIDGFERFEKSIQGVLSALQENSFDEQYVISAHKCWLENVKDINVAKEKCDSVRISVSLDDCVLVSGVRAVQDSEGIFYCHLSRYDDKAMEHPVIPCRF